MSRQIPGECPDVPSRGRPPFHRTGRFAEWLSKLNLCAERRIGLQIVNSWRRAGASFCESEALKTWFCKAGPLARAHIFTCCYATSLIRSAAEGARNLSEEKHRVTAIGGTRRLDNVDCRKLSWHFWRRPFQLTLDGQNRQSPLPSVQRMQATLASHSAISRGTYSLMLHEWTPIAHFKSQCNERRVYDSMRPDFCVLGRDMTANKWFKSSCFLEGPLPLFSEGTVCYFHATPAFAQAPRWELRKHMKGRPDHDHLRAPSTKQNTDKKAERFVIWCAIKCRFDLTSDVNISDVA